MIFCKCNGTTRNTGTSNKQRVVASGVKLIAVRMKADDGTFNEILADDVITEDYILAKINNPDESKRWYPIGEFRNQDDTRAETAKETLTSGENILTQQGVRTYLGWLINYAPVYLETLRSLACSEFGLLVVDDCKALTGSVTQDGLALRPTRVNKDSWNPTYMKGTPSASAKVVLEFEFSQIEKDEYLRVISADEMDVDLLQVEGLLPLKADTANVSTAGFTSTIFVDFDLFLDVSKQLVPAWVAADFSILNKTANTAVAITSVTEAPEGTYAFVIPAQTAGDVLELENIKTSGAKPGFALKETIIIP